MYAKTTVLCWIFCSFDIHDFPKLVLGNLGMIEFRTFEEGKTTAIITFVNTATFKSSRIENFYCLFDKWKMRKSLFFCSFVSLYAYKKTIKLLQKRSSYFHAWYTVILYLIYWFIDFFIFLFSSFQQIYNQL